MNFNIIENYDVLENINIDSFVNDYNDKDLSINKLCEKHELGYGRYKKIVNELRDTYGYCEGSRKFRKGKHGYSFSKFYHYSKNHDVFVIQRKGKFYCNAKTEDEAKKIVEFLKQHNWDKELCDKTFNKGKTNIKNYSEHKGGYNVIRKGKYYARFGTEDEAKEAVKWLRKHNWDKELFKQNYER